MLKELKIRNLAIIDDLTVRFEKGLNVLTGETGAGKSIIVDALGLALGDRAQTDLVKSGEKEASVQACFDLDDTSGLPDAGIDYSDGILLRRVVSAGGKSRAYVNDNMVTLQTLLEIGKALVDIHSQHEHQSLLTAEKQRALLDSYGKLRQQTDNVSELFGKVSALEDLVRSMRESVKDRAHRLDLLKFQLQEIEDAALKPGEREALEEDKKILSNLNKLTELSETAYSLLYGSEVSCVERLSRAIAALKEMRTMDPNIADMLGDLESALPLIADASKALRGYVDRYDFEPGRLEVVEDRLELIRKLEKKHGAGVETILESGEKAKEEIRRLETTDEKLADAEKELAVKEEELIRAAETLSAGRQRTAREIEGIITGVLSELAFGNAGFRIDIRQDIREDGRPRVGPKGMDRVEFMFSANPGEPLKPLARIASGGELSRVMLALKSVLAGVDNIPVLIFDEVDAGIGGRTAGSVGEKLAMMSERRQLICITHLPQIASQGDFHLRIEKHDRDNRVRVEVRELNEIGRRDEIARMLGGRITDISRRHADELLEKVKCPQKIN